MTQRVLGSIVIVGVAVWMGMNGPIFSGWTTRVVAVGLAIVGIAALRWWELRKGKP